MAGQSGNALLTPPPRGRTGAGAALVAVVAGLTCLALSGCDSEDSGKSLSEAQLAYNVCVDSFNDKFRGFTGNKAIVSGVDNGRTECFWTWNNASVDGAIERATASCRAKMAGCFLFATNLGLSSWSQAISSNGGSVPSNYPSVAGGGEGESRSSARRYPCRVDPIANYVMKVPENSCSVRDVSREACGSVVGAFGFKADNGSGFTECFFRPG